MLLTKIKRVTRAGFMNFWRNSWVSLAAILVVVITLFAIGSLIFSRAILGSVLSQVQNRIDISVYFKTDAEEKNILALKDLVSKLDEIKSVEYVSAEEALASFREKHKDNALINQSLEEIGGNPLGAALNIKAKEISQYESIAKFLDAQDNTSAGSIIDKINYLQNKKVIDRLSVILDSVRNIGLIISLILIGISVLVTFNTIRLAIYSARDEVEVMRLVGASSKFVSGPFIVEGVMYGFISAMIVMVLFYPFTLWIGSKAGRFFGDLNVFEYYITNFSQVFFTLLAIGVVLGAVSSFIAVRRYLKV